MAIMIPGSETLDDFNFSGGELRLHEVFAQLPDDYYIFHSTSWNEKRRRNEFSRKTYVQWGEADFTLFHPQYGVIVFEVKDGTIAYSQDRGWTQTNRQTGSSKIIDPMQQAEKSKYYFLEQVKGHFGGSSPYTFCSAVWFTAADKDCVDGQMPHNYNSDTVLWNNDMVSVEAAKQAIHRVFHFHDVRRVTPSEELTQKMLDILSPEFGAFQSIRSSAMINKAMFHRMTMEQAYLLDYLEEQEEAAIHGVAGTGKTVLAVQKALRLSETGNVLFLCFNRFLKEHLERANQNPAVSFYNIDGLAASRIRKAWVSPDERDELIENFLLDYQNYNWNFKHIVIDEGQDFKDEHLLALHEIAREQKGCFYVFYDRNQFIQGLKFPEWLDQMECRLVLSRNCRNTKEIAVTSTRPIGIKEEKIKMRREMPATDGSLKPNLFFVPDKEKLKEYIARLVKKYRKAKLQPKNIVVLSMKAEGASILTDEDLKLDGTTPLSKTSERNTVLFTTVRKFKGLEADAIICIDIDENTFINEKKRSVFYVGTSRATTFLDMITMESPEKLASAIVQKQIQKRPQSIKAIRDSLKVKMATSSDLEE